MCSLDPVFIRFCHMPSQYTARPLLSVYDRVVSLLGVTLLGPLHQTGTYTGLPSLNPCTSTFAGITIIDAGNYACYKLQDPSCLCGKGILRPKLILEKFITQRNFFAIDLRNWGWQKNPQKYNSSLELPTDVLIQDNYCHSQLHSTNISM